MRTVVGVWRWRRSPLCRATDLGEAWLALAAVVLLLVAVPVVGWIGASSTDEALRRAVRLQHQRSHPATATVLGPLDAGLLPAAHRDHDPDTAAAEERRRPVAASWTGPDGRLHSGTLFVAGRTPRAGDTFPVWTDREGRIVPRPMEFTSIRAHAVLAGIGAAVATALLVECVRRLVLRHLVRRRFADLDRAWAAVGPDWGRAGAGS